jgi:hypothetical protein
MTTTEAKEGLYDYSAWENSEGIWEEHKLAKEAAIAAAIARRAQEAPVEPTPQDILVGRYALVAA